MPQVPSTNNVYGSIVCGVSLAHVQRCLLERVGLSQTSVRLYESGYDGAQMLSIETASIEMEIRAGHGFNTWFFDGAVAGNTDEIRNTLAAVCRPLAFAGFPSKLEIYDEEYALMGVAEFGAQES